MVAERHFGLLRLLWIIAALFIWLSQPSAVLLAAPEAPDAGVQVIYNPPSCLFPTTPWDPAAQAAFEQAAAVWDALLVSDQLLRIHACWASHASLGVLGYGGTTFLHADFDNAPLAGTLYPAALANALAGSDLNDDDGWDSDGDGDDMDVEIVATFDSQAEWDFSTDGVIAKDKFEFFSVVLHELGHALGITGGLLVDGVKGWWWNTMPNVYDRFAEDAAGISLLDTTTYPDGSAELAQVLQSGAIYFDGPFARDANGGERVPLYAPAQYSSSTYHHLDDAFDGTVDALMTPNRWAGESYRHPGWVALGLLRDMGWTVADDGGPDPDPGTDPEPNPDTGTPLKVYVPVIRR